MTGGKKKKKKRINSNNGLKQIQKKGNGVIQERTNYYSADTHKKEYRSLVQK